MADQKISDLTALTGANVADTDLLPIVDTSATETKKITFGEFKTALDTATGFVRITGDTMTGALDVQSTITADGLTVDVPSTQDIIFQRNGGGSGKLELDFASQFTNFNSVVDGFKFYHGGIQVLQMRSGDISFYEDTGTTAKFFWDASAESLGIGTSSPSQKLTLNSGYVQTGNGIGGAGGVRYPTSAASADCRTWRTRSDMAGYGDWGIEQSTTQNGETFVPQLLITASGNVGIGTSSPVYKIDGGFATQTWGWYLSSAYNAGFTYNTADRNLLIATKSADSSDHIKFATGVSATERMRIDSSGNVLVGKTSTLLSDTGHNFNQSGFSFHTRSGGAVAYFNRTTSDGNIAEFFKDGATVGSIGAAAGGININSQGGDFAIRRSGGDVLYVGATATYPAINNGTDLGVISYKWKNLWLAGGIIFGDAGGTGTPTSNTLDSYEEGTWTPSYISTGATWSTYFEQVGRYTKIGNLVSITGRIRSNATATGTLTNNVRITGLPFTSLNVINTQTSLAVGLQTFSTTISPMIDYNSIEIVMYKSNTADQFIASDTNTTKFFAFSGSYIVA